MKDYKELIAELRTHILAPPRQTTTIEQQAADAIVQLIKERDAAIADLRKTASCLVCKHFGENGITCDALNQCLYGEHDVWEWRGLQEVEHEVD